ncbi:MAG: hypothetical protein U0746_04700 [Gemmataceae bacterium]
MSVATVCPYCNARLRVPETKPGAAIRVKCRVCHSHFHPTVVMAPGAADVPSVAPRPVTAPHPIEEPAVPVRSPDASERRRERRIAARERLRQQKSRETESRKLGSLELLLAGGLVCGGLVAVAALVWQTFRPNSAGVPSESYALPTDGDRRTGQRSESHLPPVDVPIKSVLAPDIDRPLPARLFGLWDLRSDDIRRGTLEFSPSGMLSARAWIDTEESIPFQGKWHVIGEDNDEFRVEAGPEPGLPNNLLLTLVLTGPDAFTVKETIARGVRNREAQRFVRRGDRRPTPSDVLP